MEAGARRLDGYGGFARVRLGPDELRRLRVDPGAVAGGGEAPISLCDVLALKGLGTSLVRVRSLLDELRARDQAARAMPPPSGTEPGGAPPAPGSAMPLTPEQLRAFLTERILGQVADLPGLDRPPASPAARDLEKIKAAIDALELSGGPANVTAFHDLYSLQVAFKHVWTAAFDDRLRAQAAELAETANRLHEEYGLEVPDVDAVRDLNDFRRFLSELDQSLRFVEVLPIDPDVRQSFPQLDVATWNRLDEDGRSVLRTAAYNHLHPWSTGDDIDPPLAEWSSQEYLDRTYDQVLRNHLTAPLARAERIILEMSERLREPYSFHYFAPGTVNFGILQTWRQEWIPDSYQVGRLVSTLPLAPGEKRTFRVKHVVKSTRAQKQVEKSIAERSGESQTIARAEAEAMNRTSTATNFRMTAQGSISLGIGSMSSTSEFGLNQTAEATQTKKAFQEATRKAAESVRQEREVQVETTRLSEAESEATHELSNPNNELTVTYLLYELERRYFLSTYLHRVQPVVLVAMDIPAPHEITETWLLEHAWILKRALLDDGFLDAFGYLEAGSASADSMDIELKKANWTTQKGIVDRLESDLSGLLELRDRRRQEMIRLREMRERAAAGESDADDVASAIFSGGLSLLFGGSSTPDRSALLEAQRKSVEQNLEYMAQQIEDLQARLSRSQTALQQATEDYSGALKERERSRTLLNQLVLHVRQNILHYMHAIWDSTHPDQVFLELYHREVDVLEPVARTCRLREATPEERAADVPRVVRDGVDHVVVCDPPRLPPGGSLPTRRRQLVEIADLERPLGYKGNYVMFPLKQCTYITDFMMQEFVDDYFGVRDPANPDGYRLDELLAYAARLWNDPDARLTDAERDALRALVLQKLTSSTVERDTVILPTGNLHMEALKGEQALLEDFKLAHRGLDVIKVEEEIRQARLENLRRVARLTETEPDLEQPTADKVIVVKGDGEVTVPVTDT
jgi:hypothetical protein